MACSLFVGSFVLMGCESSTDAAASSGGGGGVSLRAPEFPPVPAIDVPASSERIQLGANLYFDTRLSGSGGTACNSCHVSTTNFQDSLPASSPDRSAPNDSPLTFRNTPSLVNVSYSPVVRWDGSHVDLVEALALPFAEPNMNLSHLPPGDETNDVGGAKVALKAKLSEELPGYAPLFQSAFGLDVSTAPVDEVWRATGTALLAYVSTVNSRDAPFDRWNAGDDDAIGEDAVRGFELFRGKAGCAACHSGAFFTDFRFHNVSTSPPDAEGNRPDEGRYLVSGAASDRGAFLTPTLRQVYDTGPYFHNGSQGNLRALIRFLASAAVTSDPLHDSAFDTPPTLTEGEISDLVAFLRALRAENVDPGITPYTP